VVLGLLLASLAASITRFRPVFLLGFFLPILISPAIIGLVWGWILHPEGVLNALLGIVGLGALQRGWLGDVDLTLYALIFVWIWQMTGFMFIILYAALGDVSQDLLDAAHIDGAGPWARLINVTVPQISHVIVVTVVLGLIYGFAAFDLVYVMTGGGPAGSTELIATYTYRAAFMFNDVGYGAALSVLITIGSLVAAMIVLRITKGGERE
jgi:ABC-type sugar transport system permease subunit